MKTVGLVSCLFISEQDSAQHFADLAMIENEEAVRPAFVNCTTGDQKDIKCIQVNGSADEGPVHEEVQYWWTRCHLETKRLSNTHVN